MYSVWPSYITFYCYPTIGYWFRPQWTIIRPIFIKKFKNSGAYSTNTSVSWDPIYSLYNHYHLLDVPSVVSCAEILWCEYYECKVRVIPQQAWTSPRGFGSVKALDFLDVRHYKGGRSSAIRTGRFYPSRNPWYSFSEAESTPGHMVPSEPQKKSPAKPPGIDPGTVRLIAQCLNHYATPGPTMNVFPIIFRWLATLKS